MKERILGYFTDLSLRDKLLASFGVILLITVLPGLNSLGKLSSVKQEVSTVVDKIQPALLAAGHLYQELEQAAMSLGFYLLTKEDSHLTGYDSSLKSLGVILSELNESQVIQDST